MFLRAATLTFLAFTASSVSAQTAGDPTAERFVAQCIQETHARGAYEIRYGGAIPQVVAGTGATVGGTSNVNDCLADKLSDRVIQLTLGFAVVLVFPKHRGDNLEKCHVVTNFMGVRFGRAQREGF